MEGNAYLGELSAGVIYLLAGARLVLLSIRTAETPERFLGGSFILIGISGILYSLPDIQFFSAVETPIYFAARVVYLPGCMLIALFTERVFRPDCRWAKWLVRTLTAMVVTGVGGSVANGDWEGFSLGNGWFWFEWAGYTLPSGWAAMEAFREDRQARRRVKIGLCEPSVCNRMFLWSLFGVIQFSGCVVVLGQYAAYERENVFTSTWDLLYSGATLVALIVMWITFFPPAFYRRWIDGATHNRSAAEG
jgi:branched-subunit amino acid transport protein